MTRQFFSLTLLIIGLFFIASSVQAETAAMTDAHKKEVISVLEKHIKDNPKIVIDAIESYQLQEKMAEEEYAKGMAKADGDEQVIAALKAELEKDRKRFADNRVEVRANMTASHWAGGVPNK